MKFLKISKFNWTAGIAFFMVMTMVAQTETKTYRESFNATPEIIIDVNTSYTDVVFETWNKNTVEVQAEINVTDVTAEEAQQIFDNWNFEAIGNSKKISISTDSGNSYPMVLSNNNFVFRDFDVHENVMPILTEMVPTIIENIVIPEMPPMPPMPMLMGNNNFDYDAYKKDGDKYLRKWKKEFSKNFDNDFKKEIEAWKQEMEAHQKEMKLHQKEMIIELRNNEKERQEVIIELKEHQRELREEQRKVVREVKEVARVKSRMANRVRVEQRRMMKKGNDVHFYRIDTDKKHKNAKKKIIIKMPKGSKLKINVRHGEVKLANTVKNIKATLSHTRLFAANVEGEDTFIESSYAPVEIYNWSDGQLKVNYVKDVKLSQVGKLRLKANSSDITIAAIAKSAIISGTIGTLTIDKINDTFSTIDIVLEHSDANLLLPKSAYTISVNGDYTKINYPERLVVSEYENDSTTLIKGHHKSKNTDKSITINAKHSNIVLH